ncbi:MAG: hypothetical protein D4R93_06335 [Deltaproteobacteria bacterium]|nr:MAG: hypothetical protein D4R93_06335 [Deltaproteobacteria bacterium]
MQSNRKRQSSEKGFALATALMACAILFALAMLIIQLSTSDLKVSSRSVGEKKASIAAEAGIHQVLNSFDPASPPTATNVAVDAVNAPGSVYSFAAATTPASGPAFAPMKGYSIGGGQQWGQRRYVGSVTGRNTYYNSSVTIDLGMGYGPIEISTMSR